MLMHYMPMVILSIVLRQKDREFFKPLRIKLTNCLIVFIPVETKARKCWMLDYTTKFVAPNELHGRYFRVPVDGRLAI